MHVAHFLHGIGLLCAFNTPILTYEHIRSLLHQDSTHSHYSGGMTWHMNSLHCLKLHHFGSKQCSLLRQLCLHCSIAVYQCLDMSLALHIAKGHCINLGSSELQFPTFNTEKRGIQMCPGATFNTMNVLI